MKRKKPTRATGQDGKPDWPKQLRFDIEYAKQQIRDHGSCDMLLVIYPRSGPPNVLYAGKNLRRDAGSKESMYGMAHLIAIATDATAFAFISEAWMAPADSPVLPSQSERREECIVACVCHRDEHDEKHWLGDMWRIERGPNGKPNGFTHIGADKMVPENFRVRDIIPDQSPNAESVMAARQALAELQNAGVVASQSVRARHDA